MIADHYFPNEVMEFGGFDVEKIGDCDIGKKDCYRDSLSLVMLKKAG